MFAHGKEDLAMFVKVQVTSHRSFLMALEILIGKKGILPFLGKQPGKLHFGLQNF